MQMSEQTSEIFAAIAAAQGKMGPAIKNAKNPHYGSMYADLASVADASQEALADNGLAVVQEAVTDVAQGLVGVRTMVTHKSGQWITFEPLWARPSRGLAVQDVGSIVTYLRRYTKSPAIGIFSDDDDDGETAEGRGKNAPTTNEAPTEQAGAKPPKPASKLDNPRYKERTVAQAEPAMSPSDRVANVVVAFKELGWTAEHVEEAVGKPLAQFGEADFKLAKEIYNTERNRNSKANQARAQFEKS